MATETQRSSRSDSDDNRGRNQYTGAAGKSGSQSGNQTPASQKRAMTKVLRVLNEIEHRIHELREELAEQTGQSLEELSGNSSRSRSRSNQSGQSQTSESDEHDDDVEANGQGRVKHPETDGRLKQNRDDHDEGDDNRGGNSGSRSGGRSMQPGVPGNKAGTLNKGRGQSRQDDHDDDDDTESHGQGRVKNPESDGRLKQNRD